MSQNVVGCLLFLTVLLLLFLHIPMWELPLLNSNPSHFLLLFGWEWCLVVVTISVLEAGCWAPLLCAVLGHTASSDKRGRVRCLQVPHGQRGQMLCTQLLHIKLLTLLFRVRFLQEQTRPFFSRTLFKDTLLGLAGRQTYMQTYLCANTSLQIVYTHTSTCMSCTDTTLPDPLLEFVWPFQNLNVPFFFKNK